MIDPLVLIDLQQTLLDAVCECLDQTALGRPSDCFLSHNEPPDDCCDAAVVWIERLRPSEGSADAQYVTGGRLDLRCDNIGYIADINIRVMRDCYPVTKDDPNAPFPTAEEMQSATEARLQDVWVLNCCMLDVLPNLFSDIDDCLTIGVGDIVPHGPRGGCAGWTWDISVELPRCCR